MSQKDYRLHMTSRGHQMPPINFSAGSDEEAREKAKEYLDLQQKSDPEGTASIISLFRIDVREVRTRI